MIDLVIMVHPDTLTWLVKQSHIEGCSVDELIESLVSHAQKTRPANYREAAANGEPEPGE